MEQEFILTIQFNRAMNGPEQNSFWDELANCLRSIKAFGGGQQDLFSITWVIDYSLTRQNEHDVKKYIALFLEQQKEIIKDFSFYNQSPRLTAFR